MSRRILVVEDEAPIREMLCFVLEQKGYQAVEAEDYDTAVNKLCEPFPDLVLLDWMLPGGSGINFIKHMKREELTRNIPVVMLTARGEEEDKVRGLEVGADDYITKPFLEEEFCARVTNLLTNKLLIDQVNQQKKELMKMAMTDPLTSLSNRHALMQFVPKYIETAKRNETPLSVMIIDLDHFKNVNDTYGHDVGDIVLKTIGELLKNISRDIDFVARFGGPSGAFQRAGYGI